MSAMKKSKERKAMTNRQKNIIQYSLIVLATVSLGITTGVVIKKNYGQVETDYSNFNPEEFKANSSKLLKEYEKNPNKNFTPSELVNIGLEKYRICENSYSIGVGQASTIVNQTIRNAQAKNGNQYFEESISRSSMVSLANRVNQVGDEISAYKGKAKDSDTGEYKNEPVKYQASDYKTNWGKTLEEMFIYIISDKSVLTDKCSINKDSNYIKVHLELDTDIASYYYKIQMKTISNLSSLPTFEYLKQTYTFDSNMTLLHCRVDEKYKASMAGVSANIHNLIDYYYHANEYLKIPELNESIDYSLKGETQYE